MPGLPGSEARPINGRPPKPVYVVFTGNSNTGKHTVSKRTLHVLQNAQSTLSLSSLSKPAQKVEALAKTF